jgi:ATP-binding cassette subfamily B (MDR/TAP) protein 1
VRVRKLTRDQYFGTFGAFGLAFWYGTQRYITGAISSVSAVIIVLMSVMMVIASLGRIAAPLMAVSKAMVAACELFIVIDAPSPASGSLRPDIESKGVIFDSVTFEYPSRPGVKVLDAVSFRIQPGRSTAFVGPSGSGKSTVCALLEKWYSLRSQHTIPQVIKEDASKKDVDKEKTLAPHESSAAAKTSNLSGSITIGGHNLEDLDTKWWRTQIGIVQQEPFLFNGSIYDNVVNGLLGSIWEHESAERKSDLVREACHEAYAHEFIDRLPDVSFFDRM